MDKKLIICEVNEEYLITVKDQMKKQNMPIPKDDSQITIAHKPMVVIDLNDLQECNCKVCKKINNNFN